jgi:hypothetical protein
MSFFAGCWGFRYMGHGHFVDIERQKGVGIKALSQPSTLLLRGITSPKSPSPTPILSLLSTPHITSPLY